MPLIKAAVAHKGAAFIDVVSPCVAFNNHPGSTKSYDYVREHNEAVNRLDFMPERDADHRRVSARAASAMSCCTTARPIRLRKLDAEYDPTDKVGAMAYLESRRAHGEVVTGLLYVDAGSDDMHAALADGGGPVERAVRR